MSRLILDARAFVAFERGDARVRARLAAAHRLGLEVTTTSPTRIDAPNESAARRAGELLVRSRTDDVVDALLVGLARDGDMVVTSDPDDVHRLLAAAGTRATVLTV